MTRNLRKIDRSTVAGHLAGVALLALAGCQANVKLPSNLVLACSQTSDCPSGEVCDLGVCVPQSKDEPAPALTTAPTVTPAIGTAGTKFQIVLSTTEALAALPTVTLELPTPVPLACTMTDTTHFACTYTATGMENGGLGGVIPFNVGMVNTVNIPNTVVSAGTITIDSVLPQVAASGITIIPATALPGGAATVPTVAGLGATISVWLTASKPLASPPMLTMTNTPLSGVANPVAMTQVGTSLTYNFNHVVVADDPTSTTFSATLIDDVGNTKSATIGMVTIDPVALVLSNLVISDDGGPTVGSPPRFSAVAGYNEVWATFTSSKVLPTPPTATITAGVPVTYAGDAGPSTDGGTAVGSLPMTCTSTAVDAGASYVCKYQVTGHETTPGGTPISSIAEETEQVVINTIDDVGSVATIGGPIVFDLQPPELDQSTVTINYVPGFPINSVLEVATAAGPNSTVVISGSANEPLSSSSSPSITLTPPATPAPEFNSQPSAGPNSFIFQATIGTMNITGNYQVAITNLVDLVGNSTASSPLEPQLVIENNSSVSGNMLDTTAITQIRAPWGNASSFGVPYSALMGATDGTNGQATIAVFSGPGSAGAPSETNPATADLIGIITANVDGAFGPYVASGNTPGTYSYNLPPVDYPVLYVASVNAAGVPSAREEVMKVSWYGNLWSSATDSNASTLVKVSSFGPPLVPNPQDAFPSSTAQMIALAPTGGTPSTIQAGGVWQQRALSTASPGARSGASYAFDTRRGVGVLFGGTNGNTDLGDTWEWDGSEWTQRYVQGPSPRTGAAMAFDPLHGVAVLFGGFNGSYLGDTWTWDGTTWRNVTPSLGSPSARWNSAMTWDSALNAIVLFGGDSGVLNKDLMMWNGSSWTVVSGCSGNAGPPARSLHTLTYLPSPTNVLVVAGGSGVSGDLGDTWLCTPGGAWTSGPNLDQPREGAVSALVSGNVVIFGGLNGSTSTALNNALEWNGSGSMWTQLTQPPSSMSARTQAAGGWDTVRNEMDIVGGTDGSGQYCTAGGYCADNWGFNPTASPASTAWADETPLPLPPALTGAAAAYDSAHGQTVIFGGSDENGNASAQTLLWDGHHWLQPAPSMAPPARSGAAMAYYSPVGGSPLVVLFGGDATVQSPGCMTDDGNGGFQCDDTWTWDGMNWALASSGSPTARSGHVMGYDPGQGDVVMYGGVSDGTAQRDVETWTPGGWVQQSPGGSPPGGGRTQASFGYDAEAGDSVLFGGYIPGESTPQDTTFLWNSGTSVWSSATTGPARAGQVMAYNSARDHLVMFGGQTSSGLMNDVWDWTGGVTDSWISRTPMPASAGTVPGARVGAVGVFDTQRNRFVVFGGTNSGGEVLGDVWELSDLPTAKPAEIASLNFAETGDLNNIASSGFGWTLTADIGGSGSTTLGATAQVWSPSLGAWSALTTSGSASTASAMTQGSLTATGNNQDAVLGADGYLHFAFLPLGAQGTVDGQLSQVSLWYAEVMVQYTKAK